MSEAGTMETVPDDVDILGGSGLLPELPHFEINMLGSMEPSSPVASALCGTIRDAFANQHRE